MIKQIPVNIIENEKDSGTYNGVEAAVKNDASVTFNGTSTEKTGLWILSGQHIHPLVSIESGVSFENVSIHPFIGNVDERLVWDKTGERCFETGADHGILYPMNGRNYRKGTAWNGLTSVNESTDGGESSAQYADNKKYLNLVSDESLKLTIEAYTYPQEFDECLGRSEIAQGVFIAQQKRRHFGFCYRTKIGNDTEGSDFEYKIHIIFDCLASPSDSSHSTITDSPEAMSYSWEISTAPVIINGKKPSSDMVLDSGKFRKEGLTNVLKAIERRLYGTRTTNPTFLKPSQINDIFTAEMYIKDSAGNIVTDSFGTNLRSRVFD